MNLSKHQEKIKEETFNKIVTNCTDIIRLAYKDYVGTDVCEYLAISIFNDTMTVGNTDDETKKVNLFWADGKWTSISDDGDEEDI